MILIKSAGIKKISNLGSFFSEPVKFIGWYSQIPHNQNIKIAGWGRKKSFFKAQKMAQKYNISTLCLEDGFIRSMGLGVDGCQPLSIVIDEQGIYFDAYHPSTLEQLIVGEGANSERAIKAIAKIKAYQLSKYNHAPVISLKNRHPQKNILVVDQTYGDQSIRGAGATPAHFHQMLQQAKKDHPDGTIWLKIHPDVISGKKKGHYSVDVLQNDQVQVITEACNPVALLEQMDEVYVVSSHMGFEALMLNKKVHCFGVPWYAGWGLTNDQYAPMDILKGRRQVKRTIAQLFSAAYFKYARYVDPNSGQRCELEDILDVIARQKFWAEQLRGEVHAWGFSPWKQGFIRQYLKHVTNRITFLSVMSAKDWIFQRSTLSQHVVLWGYKEPKRFKSADTTHAKIWRMEDGFIRSIGLGANLIRPLSLVLDDQGIYYDPNQPSRLETILNNIQLLPEQQQRAQQLRLKIVCQHLSKYNVGEAESWPDIPQGKTVILVPGQVEDDASVQLGGCGIFSNLELLKAVRSNKPDAWIIYKPHPDVEAGLRPGKIVTEMLHKYANSVIYKLDMPSCLDKVDEIHTISSLTGFEALLRQKKVYCYGLPFYAGWGLTEDRINCERRQKRLTLDELVYGVLISYPLYKLPDDDNPYLATPEQIIDYIVEQRQTNTGSNLIHKKSWLARLRALLIYKR